MWAELCGSVAQGGQGAQHQQFALSKGEPTPGVEVAEAKLSEDHSSAVSNGSGRSATLSLISSPCIGIWTARPVLYRSVSVTLPCTGRGSGIPLAWRTSLIVATAFRVRGKR